MVEARVRAEVRALLREPWERFVAGVEARARRLGGEEAVDWQEMAAIERGWGHPRSSWKVSHDLGLSLEREVAHLARGPKDRRVRALGCILDGTPTDDWGGEALRRALWARRWGLPGGGASRERLKGAALRRALVWMAESHRESCSSAAQRWWRAAARAGDVKSAACVAYALERRKRYREALPWSRQAALGGDTCAAVNVGYALFYGRGVRRDRRAAAAWYRRAATSAGARSLDRATRLDAAAAMANLGRMYREGEGVPQSWPTAIRWFTRAARRGSKEGAHILAGIYGGEAGSRAKPALELRWLRVAARRGCSDCVCALGVHAWNGRHIRRNRPRAMRLYERAAKAGDRWAMYLMGRAYREIDPPRRNLEASRLWLRRAAGKGVKEAARLLRKRPAAEVAARP
jgi:TPR repeat protein